MLSLEPHEFFVGTLADAKSGSMLLPRTDREANAYIGNNGDKPFAILLSGEHTRPSARQVQLRLMSTALPPASNFILVVKH